MPGRADKMEYSDSVGDSRLEWDLAQEQARLAAEQRPVVDLGARQVLAAGRELLRASETDFHTKRAKQLIQEAGMLAAGEARAVGIRVSGWRFKPGKDFDGGKDKLFSPSLEDL